MKQLVIASRESALAMWQAEHIQARLQALYPGLSVSILGMTTQGDQILDKTLSKIGGKGLFVKELEVALQEGRADLAVHSMKDVPCKFNLIPFNPFPGSPFRRSPAERVRRFGEILIQAGIVTTTRKTRGDDIDAACGQLAGQVKDKTRRTAGAVIPIQELRT